jgi:hypothetical protein
VPTTFSIQQSAAMTVDFAARLAFQIERFELNDRYPKAVNDFLGGQRASIEDTGRKSPQALRRWLNATYGSLQHTHGLNDWRTALMAAALGKISPGLLGKLRPDGSRDGARNLAQGAGRDRDSG